MIILLITLSGCSTQKEVPRFKVSFYPYGAKSAFWFTSDDLNPALYATERPQNSGKLLNDSSASLKALIWMGNMSRQYQVPVCYGIVPCYTPAATSNSGRVIADFTRPEYKKWREVLLDFINEKIAWLFFHGMYHSIPIYKRPTNIGGYEDASDWQTGLDLIEQYFMVEIKTFRSPFYRPKTIDGWTFPRFIDELKNIGITTYLDEHTNGMDNYGYKDGLFFIGTYDDRYFQKDTLRHVKTAFKNGWFLQESCPFIYFLCKTHRSQITKIFKYISKKGVNKYRGIWCPLKPAEIKDWYDVILSNKYTIQIITAKQDHLELDITCSPGYKMENFTLIIKNIPDITANLPFKTLQRVNNNTFVVSFPITDNTTHIAFYTRK
ncbi:MAG: hypothetical protein ABH952_05355 [Candidatus Omnitrophota bacterium]